MRIPKSFELGGMEWKVVQIPDLAELGRCLRDVQTIQLKENEKPQTKQQTFCHELMHAIKYTLGEADDHDEKVVDLMGTMFHQFLKTAKYK
jgi:hypothetical protein